MAEFAEVLRQYMRLHKACNSTCYDKNGEMCPLYEMDSCAASICFFDKVDAETIKQFEAVVMAWAQKNPEPVYPTWREVLTGLGFVKHIITAYGAHTRYLWDEPIPAEIAEGLGIQPINGGAK